MLALPAAKNALRPLAVLAAQGVMEGTERLGEVIAGLKEGLQDILAEAQFEKAKQAAPRRDGSPPG